MGAATRGVLIGGGPAEVAQVGLRLHRDDHAPAKQARFVFFFLKTLAFLKILSIIDSSVRQEDLEEAATHIMYTVHSDKRQGTFSHADFSSLFNALIFINRFKIEKKILNRAPTPHRTSRGRPRDRGS